MAFRLQLVDDSGSGRKKLGPALRAGQTPITNGTATVTGTFSTAMPNTSYALIVQLFSTDGTPQFQPVTITSKTTAGFTAKWNANVDSVNYVLDYIAIGNQ